MKRLRLIFLLAACYFSASAILPPLEREVNLSLNNEQFSTVLLRIQEQTGLVFSYKPSIIAGIGPVSLQLKHKTVREALALMLPKNIIYKSKNNYIILKEKPENVNAKKTEISGYVYDKETEQKLPNVTIYDKESLQSATTDEYGFYSINVPKNNKISVNKENYQDTVLHLSDTKESKLNNIVIAPASEKQKKQDSTDWRNKLKDLDFYTNQLYKKFKGFINTINVRDTITRKVQVSVVPFIGTNHKLSGNVVNRLSFNILGGFAKGLRGFEIGGLFNIDGENASGMQMAGVFNIVGDTMRGTQIAGYFNITGNNMKGFQAAGLMNMNSGTVKGVQVASLLNINRRSLNGAGFAGVMNINGSVRGAQLAGIGNKNDTLKGVAIAGLFNVSNCGDKAAQIACLFNRQKSGSAYLQVAGLFNRAGYLKGVQIAPLNFADSAKGVPIGLLSVVKKGLHQIELNGDEMFPANLSFRTGVPAFYNVLSIGFAPGSEKHLWQFGYGAGTSFKLGKKLRSDVTVSMHHVSSGDFYFATSELYKFYWGVEYKFTKKFSIAAGPTFNILMSDALLPDYTTYQDITPHPIFNTTNSYDFNFKGWMGCRVALRFL